MLKHILLTVLLILFDISIVNSITITIAYEDKEQPPYYMGNTTEVLANNPGVAVEMVQMLEEMIEGIEIILVRKPWARCTFELESNYLDGIFNASYKESRLKIGWYPTVDNTHAGQVDPSRRITTISYSLYKLINSNIDWNGDSIINLNDKLIGAPRGYSIVGDLQKKGINVYESNSTVSNLKILLRGRLAGVALQDVTGDSLLKAFPDKYKSIIKDEPPIVTKPYYLMLSDNFIKQNPELAKIIWDAIKLIRETKFEEIVLKYIEN